MEVACRLGPADDLLILPISLHISETIPRREQKSESQISEPRIGPEADSAALPCKYTTLQESDAVFIPPPITIIHQGGMKGAANGKRQRSRRVTARTAAKSNRAAGEFAVFREQSDITGPAIRERRENERTARNTTLSIFLANMAQSTGGSRLLCTPLRYMSALYTYKNRERERENTLRDHIKNKSYPRGLCID